MKKIAILGATSAIALACARRWAHEPCEFFFVARDTEKLAQVAADITARGAKVHTYPLDFSEYQHHPVLVEQCCQILGRIDILLVAYGTLPNQKACEEDSQQALAEFHNNGLSVISLLNHFSPTIKQQQSGTIAVISSVAGDRGRASNYLYGSAKSAVSTFCSGLRASLWGSGVHVLTIKPGFVDTPMTQHLDLPKLLTASPDDVANDIDQAIIKKKQTIYSRWYWRDIMLIIILLPGFIFNRTNF